MLFTRALQSWSQLWHTSQTTLPSEAASLPFPTFAFSETWSVLGPFQIGTREVVWGSDPLEVLGGFRELEYSHNATFRSSLAANGTISWSRRTARLADSNTQRAAVELDVDFPAIDWQGLRDIYGWAALQWQAWARGEIVVQSENVEILVLLTPGILEFYIDGNHYFGGDFYGYERTPLTLRLTPGIHCIDVRLVRDVRAMGGVGEPTITMSLVLQKSFGALHPILQPHNGVLISDLVGDEKNHNFASPYGSVLIRNDAEVSAVVTNIIAPPNRCIAELLAEIRLAPGQTRPVAFRLDCISATGQLLPLDFQYRLVGDDTAQSVSFAASPELRGIREPHKVTFLHPGGVVSYAILRPPSQKAEDATRTHASLPIFLGLHGAGLEAENEIVRHSLDPLPDLAAWALFPTGGTPWSGDDWHAWGFADVEAAIAMIPEWINRHGWQGTTVNLEKWIVAGHSNGGQGTWYALTHRPDNVFAAAPISGYSSIQNYVPYTFWHPADPGRTAIVQAALSGYRHEMLLSNAKGIPVLQQHGGADDNVPPYHSRYMSQLIRGSGADSEYYEFAGQPHWWDGVMTTDPLRDFYEKQVASAKIHTAREPLDNFSLVVANPGDTGSKHGIVVLRLTVPGQYGRVDFSFQPFGTICSVRTANIALFVLPSWFEECGSVIVDDQKVNVHFEDDAAVLERADNQWHIQTTSTTSRPILLPRHGRQLGAMDAILNTQGAFQIVTHTNSSRAADHIALQISRNLCTYFFADTVITSSYDSALEATGNIISVAIGDTLPPSHQSHSIYIENNQVYIRHPSGSIRSYPNRATSAIFLRPLPLGRLELVVWGADSNSLAVAARLVPMMTGSGQPDFVVIEPDVMMAKGLEGALAMGFYDYDWSVSSNAFFA